MSQTCTRPRLSPVLTLGEIERKEVQRRRDEADIPHDRVFALRLGYLVENGISIHTAIESVRPESMWYTLKRLLLLPHAIMLPSGDQPQLTIRDLQLGEKEVVIRTSE